MMTRMRNLDDVTAVHLAKSVRKDEATPPARTAATGGARGRRQPEEDIQDCTGSRA